MRAYDSMRNKILAVRGTLTTRKGPEAWPVALFVLSCILILMTLRMQVKNWVNIPIWDEWDTPGQTLLHLKQHILSWSDLVSQHNESRKFFPRLIYIALNAPLGWDLRYGMVLTFLSACVLSGFFLRSLGGAGKGDAGALFAWCLINALLFSPAQYENFLCGFTFEILIPALALCGCIAVNLSDRALGRKVAWNSILALIATYSFTHGMMLWALGIPSPSAAERKHSRWIRTWMFWLLAYGAVGAIAVGCYFVGYQRPDFGPLANFGEIPFIAHFVVTWLGIVLCSESVSAIFAGRFVATILFAACALSLFLVSRNRAWWPRYYPWLLLAGFSLGAGLLTAIGRAHLGIDALVATYRYKITSVFAYVSIVGLIYRLYRDWISQQRIWRARFVILITVLTTLLVVAELYLFAGVPTQLYLFRDNRRRARTAVMWSEALPRNPELFLAYPFTDSFPQRLTEMKRVGLIKTPVIGDELIHAISVAPPRGHADTGRLQGGVLGDSDVLRVFGWGANPERNTRADYVVLGWQAEGDSFHPFTAMPTGRHSSPETDKIYPVQNAGFYQETDISNLPRTPLIFSAWSVDLTTQQAFPIDGIVRLEARPKRIKHVAEPD